jgi:hypothetical protein
MRLYIDLTKSDRKGDALARWSGDLSEGEIDKLKLMEQVILKPDNLPRQL